MKKKILYYLRVSALVISANTKKYCKERTGITVIIYKLNSMILVKKNDDIDRTKGI